MSCPWTRPCGRGIGAWVEKATTSAQQGAVVVGLLPARPDTRWWLRYVVRGEVRLLRGRIQFEGGKAGPPFPSAMVGFQSAIVVFRPPQFRPVPA